MATADEKAMAVLERAVQKKQAAVQAIELQLKEEKEELESMELALEQKRRRLGKASSKGSPPRREPSSEDLRGLDKDASSANGDGKRGEGVRPRPQFPGSDSLKETPSVSRREPSPLPDRKPPTPQSSNKGPSLFREDSGIEGSQQARSAKRPRVEEEFSFGSQGSGQRDADLRSSFPKSKQPGNHPPSPRTMPSSTEQTSRRGFQGNAPGPSPKNTPPLPGRPSSATGAQSSQKGSALRLQQFHASELISKIKSGAKSNPAQPRFQSPVYVQSQQKRRLRSLIFNPVNPVECCVSSLDGSVSFWQVLRTGKGMSPYGSVDACMAKRWPEDIAWSPDGKKVIAVYEADAKSTQLASISRNLPCRGVDARPHQKGVVHCINFLPWIGASGGSTFATGGSDHAVVLWSEEPSAPADFAWKPKVLHKSQHTSAVYGVAGMFDRPVVLSAGADKRCLGMDVTSQKLAMSHWNDAKCTGVFPNPKDPNLILVQTGSPGNQLSLLDFRANKTAIQKFGWTQSSTDQQSALISASWSPNGLFISSGTQDPTVQLFDIRQIDRKAFKIIHCHEKRVFVARWHPQLPVMVSISSDLNIGVHPFVV